MTINIFVLKGDLYGKIVVVRFFFFFFFFFFFLRGGGGICNNGLSNERKSMFKSGDSRAV